MNNKSTTVNGGIGFTGLLTILFIGLKLTNHIAWSWLWVLSPLWIPVALLAAFIIPALGIAALFDWRGRRHNRKVRAEREARRKAAS